MRIKKGFNLRSICGEHIIIAEGRENIDFSKIISLNESAAYLWQAVTDRDFTIDELTRLLTKEYEVDDKTAQNDVTTMIRQWIEVGIIE